MDSFQRRIAILGTTVRNAREDRGWTQKDLAREAHISEVTVWRAENNRTISSLKAKSIARALNIPLEDLEIKLSK